jgi:hypothetical protein
MAVAPRGPGFVNDAQGGHMTSPRTSRIALAIVFACCIALYYGQALAGGAG